MLPLPSPSNSVLRAESSRTQTSSQTSSSSILSRSLPCSGDISRFTFAPVRQNILTSIREKLQQAQEANKHSPLTHHVPKAHILHRYVAPLLSSYSSFIRHPYTSDLFPLIQTPSSDARTPRNRRAGSVRRSRFTVTSGQTNSICILASRRHSATSSTSCSPVRISKTSSAPTLLCCVLTSPHTAFAPRHAGIVGPSRRAIVNVEQAKDEKLEIIQYRKVLYSGHFVKR